MFTRSHDPAVHKHLLPVSSEADLQASQHGGGSAAARPLSRVGTFSKDLNRDGHRDPSWLARVTALAFEGGKSTQTAVAGTIYCFSSGALTLLNKETLAHYDFHAVYCLLLFHCAMAVMFVQVARASGLAHIEPLTRDVVRLWIPVNVIFVGMLATNYYALQTVGIGMVTILKNLSNIFILAGDFVFFRRTYSWHVYACLSLMIGSVVTGAATDIQFSLEGYSWQMVNNCFTAAYALYLSRVTDKLSHGGAPGGKGHQPGRAVGQLSMVYYNNMLSIPLVACMVLLTGEWRTVLSSPALSKRSFQVCAVMGGVVGFIISFSSIWFVSLSTATMYSLAGSLNKVLVAAAGIVMYNESREPRNIASIAVGLVAGSLLPFIKSRQGTGSRTSTHTPPSSTGRQSSSTGLGSPSRDRESGLVQVAMQQAGSASGGVHGVR